MSADLERLLLEAGRAGDRPSAGAAERAYRAVSRRSVVVAPGWRGATAAAATVLYAAAAVFGVAWSLRGSPESSPSDDSVGAGGIGLDVGVQRLAKPQSHAVNGTPRPRHIGDTGAGRF